MGSSTRPLRVRRTIRQIIDLLKEFEKGNISAVDFCRQHNISKGTFYKWQSRYRNNLERKTKKPGFADVRIIPSSSATLFAEVNGIKIFQPVAASYLKELLQ
jgi:hypothetical protein